MNILKNLDLLNSKERFHLIKKVIGEGRITVSQDFMHDLQNETGLVITQRPFVAIDYHLDWLYAALTVDVETCEQYMSNRDRIIKGNQEDIDCIIAYEDGNKTVIIMIEAKGVTAWKNEQINSKIKRLNEIFKNVSKDIIPYFILMSPERSRGLKIENGEEWMKSKNTPYWIQLKMPKLKKVQRDTETGEKWRIAKRS